MRSKIPRVAGSVLLAAALVAFAQRAYSQGEDIPQIAVSFTLPDGSVKRASITFADVERLTGQRPAYTLLPWVLAALKTLGLTYATDAEADGIKITAISGISNNAQGEWVYSANGHPSPYRLNTQTIEGISSVAFSYRARTP